MLRSPGWTPVDASGTGPRGQPARTRAQAARSTHRVARLQRRPQAGARALRTGV